MKGLEALRWIHARAYGSNWERIESLVLVDEEAVQRLVQQLGKN